MTKVMLSSTRIEVKGNCSTIIKHNINTHVSQNLLFLKLTKTSTSLKPKNPSFYLFKTKNTPTNVKLSASSVTTDALLPQELPQDKQKLGVVVKQMGKQRLVLKFIWMQKDIGIALDQMIPGHGTIPLSPYYFWPRKDAWDELKVLLESKPWISPLQRVNLLNQATDVINLWQANGGNISHTYIYTVKETICHVCIE
ncbi:PSRP-3_Ycf65 domain-containing protein, partial [Cephalotus follicularis]